MRSKASWFLTLACALVLAGCGSQAEEPTSGSDSASESASESAGNQAADDRVGSCPVDAPAVVDARTITEADLDGDGRPEAVRLTAADGDCPSVLFAETAEGYVDARLPVGAPAASRAFAVRVPGRDGDLVVTRQDHPRGGFQLRVFAAAGSGDEPQLTELEVDGSPLVPFVALDVDEHPLSVDCADGGVVLTEAVPHEPEGEEFTWDVQRTTYTLDGTEGSADAPEQLSEQVPEHQLEERYPDLVRHSAFDSCRVG